MTRALFLAAILCASPAFAEARFFTTIEDLPLAPGLNENGGGAAFDGAYGTILVAFAAGGVAPAEVRDFYRASMGALGWSLSPNLGEELLFLRGRERLTLAIMEGERGSLVRAQLVRRAPPSPRD